MKPLYVSCHGVTLPSKNTPSKNNNNITALTKNGSKNA